MAFDFYPALGARVWALGGGEWLPGVVVGCPRETPGRWLVRLDGPERVEWVGWQALLPRPRGGAGALDNDVATAAAAAAAAARESAGQQGGGGRVEPSPLSRTRAEFRRAQFEQQAARHWDLFYRSNTVNFFKDRHWLDREFPELGEAVASRAAAGATPLLVECGCGVGNALFPLLAAHPVLRAVGVDFSARAIDFVKANPEFCPARCEAHVRDLATQPLAGAHGAPMELGAADVAMLCFVLSAVAPTAHGTFLSHVAAALKPGALLLFRDYADGDLAQKRFRPGAKVAESLEEYGIGTAASPKPRALSLKQPAVRLQCVMTGPCRTSSRRAKCGGWSSARGSGSPGLNTVRCPPVQDFA